MLSDQTTGYLTESLEVEMIPQTMTRILGQFHRIPHTLKFSRASFFKFWFEIVTRFKHCPIGFNFQKMKGYLTQWLSQK